MKEKIIEIITKYTPTTTYIDGANAADELLALFSVRSCYAVFDEEDNIVQLYKKEDKANKGLVEFKKSHPHTEFYVDTMQIN